MTIYRNSRTKDTVKVNKAITVIWSYLFGPFFYLRIGAVGHAVAYTVLCLLLWAYDLYVVVWAVYAVFAPSILRRQWLSRGLRWSGFSGQPPSLTSEAGHRPCKGAPTDEQAPHP